MKLYRQDLKMLEFPLSVNIHFRPIFRSCAGLF